MVFAGEVVFIVTSPPAADLLDVVKAEVHAQLDDWCKITSSESEAMTGDSESGGSNDTLMSESRDETLTLTLASEQWA
jgi:hypothetical protein